MLIEKILTTAKPCLENSTVSDAVIGLSLIGIQLDHQTIGLAHVLRDQLPAGCSTFGFAQELIGQNAYRVACLALEGDDDVKRGVGVAVLTAGSRQLQIPDEQNSDPLFGMNITADDTVGMIGYIPPVAAHMKKVAREVHIFDRDIALHGGDASQEVQPMHRQAELLPTCDVLVVSGTAVINHTIDDILARSHRARDIVIAGPSTPMYPEAFSGTSVTTLAGAWWREENKDALFKRLSLAGGIGHVKEFMIKKKAMV